MADVKVNIVRDATDSLRGSSESVHALKSSHYQTIQMSSLAMVVDALCMAVDAPSGQPEARSMFVV